MSTPLHELGPEIRMLAFGLLGDATRVTALFLVAHEGVTDREAERRTGIPRSTIQRDRSRYRERLEALKDAKVLIN